MSESTLSIGTEKVGARVYVTGNTYAVKAALKSAGCHWDGDRKQWWIGAAKAAAVSGIIANLAIAPPPKEDPAERRVYAKVSYKGRNYFVIGQTDDRARLTVLDGSLDFWASKPEMELLKTYEGRPERGAYGKPTGRTVYTTLGSIRRFVESQRAAEARGDEKCPACGKFGELVHDLEDGMSKCRGCCDMPADEC